MFEVSGLSEEIAVAALKAPNINSPSRPKSWRATQEENSYEGYESGRNSQIGCGGNRTKLTDARDEMMKLRFQQVTGQLTDSSRLTILRRDIARMETIPARD
jgi:ribosomal protein L29